MSMQDAFNVAGHFTEKECKGYFAYGLREANPGWWSEDLHPECKHVILIRCKYTSIHDENEIRYAIVKKTVAYVAVDEDENGNIIFEKWSIRQ